MSVYTEMQAAYDAIALSYADRNDGEFPDDLLPLADRLLQHCGPEAHLLDVGCGTGRDMAWFETRQRTTTGVDLSSGMLNYARRKVMGNLLAIDMRALAFANASFDGAWCCASLLHLPKSEAPRALAEMHRVLKAGGMLCVCTQQGSGEVWEDDYRPGVRRFFARYVPDELCDLLESARFPIRSMTPSQANETRWLACTCIAL